MADDFKTLVEQLTASNVEKAGDCARAIVARLSPLAHKYDVSVETTADFGGQPAAFVDIFPVGPDFAEDHKKFGGIFVRLWLFGAPKTLTHGLFLGAERAEQSEPRRGVAYTRNRLGAALTKFEKEEGFEYHTWKTAHFPWVTKSSRAVARQLEQFISFRQDSLVPSQLGSLEAHVLASLTFMDTAIEFLQPIATFGKAIIQEYYSENLPTGTPASNTDSLGGLANSFHGDASASKVGLRFPVQLAHRFAAAALAKNFIILTGLSGSGKTKLAQAFAVWLDEPSGPSRTLLVPVGADWTTREPLLGYPDALSPGSYNLPPAGTLQFIIRASRDLDHPYFLILDDLPIRFAQAPPTSCGSRQIPPRISPPAVGPRAAAC